MESPPPRFKKISPPPGDPMVTHVAHPAMATQFAVLLPAHQADRVECVLEALEMLDDIESALTVYSPSSEISKLNAAASTKWVKLSRPTFDLIRRSIHWSELTDGAFDITAGPLIEAWGFTNRSGRKPSDVEIEQAMRLVGYQKIECQIPEQSVRFACDGMSINLGAIGKGDALDRLTQHLIGVGINDFLLHGGASSIVARGNQFSDFDHGWAVGISHPTKPKQRLAGVWLKDTAMGTSGSGKQFFHYRGQRFGHVIDPRTGRPCGDFASLSVITPSARDADAMATGLYVGGQEMIDRLAADETSDAALQWITVSNRDRQDEMIIQSSDDIVWVDDDR